MTTVLPGPSLLRSLSEGWALELTRLPAGALGELVGLQGVRLLADGRSCYTGRWTTQHADVEALGRLLDRVLHDIDLGDCVPRERQEAGLGLPDGICARAGVAEVLAQQPTCWRVLQRILHYTAQGMCWRLEQLGDDVRLSCSTPFSSLERQARGPLRFGWLVQADKLVHDLRARGGAYPT